MFRLVTADVAFYTGNLQALKGLQDLDLNMAEIWEQKRWWHTEKLGSSSDQGMCVYDGNMDACDSRTESGAHSEPGLGKGKRSVSVLGNWDSVGSTRNAICVLPSVRSNWSGVYNIFHSLWKQTQVSLDQIQKNT